MADATRGDRRHLPPERHEAGAEGERDEDDPTRAENALTAVLRDRRRQGIATLLKAVTLAMAADHGIRTVYTWTQHRNSAMRTLNDRLGYVARGESITVRAPLPLPFPPAP